MTIRICDMLPAAIDRRWALARQLGVRHAICKCDIRAATAGIGAGACQGVYSKRHPLKA